MIEIIEVDQWTSSGDIEKLDFDTVTLQTIRGETLKQQNPSLEDTLSANKYQRTKYPQ